MSHSTWEECGSRRRPDGVVSRSFKRREIATKKCVSQCVQASGNFIVQTSKFCLVTKFIVPG